MITGNEVYWITRLTAIHHLVLGIGLVLGIVMVAVFGFYAVFCNDGKEKRVLPYLPLLIVPFFFGVASIFIPTTKEMCAIKVIPIIANNEGVQKLPNKVVELADEWMEELRPKREEK